MEPSAEARQDSSKPSPCPADGKTPVEGLFSEYSFSDLDLSPALLESIEEHGYALATPVQARCIPLALEGKDLIVRSKTGTGKTAAFGIPLIESIESGAEKPQALVLAPTRELALQGAQEIEALGRKKGVRVCAVYGGASLQAQIEELRSGVDVVVGTPGRIIDQMKRGHLDLSEVRGKVLDEADEMLSMGFLEDVRRILEACPSESQTLLFSATVSEEVESLISRYMSSPETILLSGDEYSVEGIDNILYETRGDYPKPRNLLYLLEIERPDSALIFCNTRDDTSLVAAVLNRHGWQAEILNSDLSQRAREQVMRRVKAGELRVMVATDLAARGIDISGLTHVINYSMPEDPLVYMHRVGRTGRLGCAGTAISLMGGKDLSTLSVLEKRYGVEFERRNLPDQEEASRTWAERHIRELEHAMNGSVFEAFLPLVKEIKSRPDGDFIMAHALKSYFESRRPRVEQERAGEARSEERRQSRRKGKSGAGTRPRREPGERTGPGRRKDASERPRGEHRLEEKSKGDGHPEQREGRRDGSRLFVGIGSDAGLDEAGVKEAVCKAAAADPLTVVSVDMKERHSFLICRDEDAARALLSANGREHGDTVLKIEVARGARRRQRSRPRRRTSPGKEG